MTAEEIQTSIVIKTGLTEKGLTQSQVSRALTQYANDASLYGANMLEVLDYLYTATIAQYGSWYSLRELVSKDCTTYLLIEDTMSGMDFWKAIIDALGMRCNLVNPSIVLKRPSGGLRGVYDCLKVLNVQHSTYYILCDSDDTNRSTDHLDLLEEISTICENTEAFHFIPDYICFESLFIGFENIWHWAELMHTITGASQDRIQALSAYIRQETYNRNTLRKWRKEAYTKSEESLASIEELCDIALRLLFSKNRSQIAKDGIGDCWRNACCNIQYETCNMNNDITSYGINNKLLYILLHTYFYKTFRKEVPL